MEIMSTHYQCVKAIGPHGGGILEWKSLRPREVYTWAAVMDSVLDSCCSVLYYSNPSLPKAKEAF